MNTIRPFFLFPFLFRDVIFRIPETEKRIYLTFDDGPTGTITSKILVLLKRYHARATFFVCGKQVESHPLSYRQLMVDGHAIGNHSYGHPNGWKTGTKSYLSDIDRADEITDSRLFRPPYGKLTLRQYRHLRKKFRIVVWDVMSMDFDKATTKEQCFQNIRKHVRPGSIIVFHDSVKAAHNMLYALEQTLIVFGKEGYTFAPLDFATRSAT